MSDAGYSMLGAGAWGWPTEMLWGGRWEGGSCLGMPVRIKDFKIKKKKKKCNSFQLFSHVWFFETSWTGALQASLSITNSLSLFKLMSIESVMPSNHLILSHPFLLPLSILPSTRVFSNELVLCIRWSKYWSFSFSIIPSTEYSALISFRIDWLDLLAVQGTPKSLLQHHSSKASILWQVLVPLSLHLIS